MVLNLLIFTIMQQAPGLDGFSVAEVAVAAVQGPVPVGTPPGEATLGRCFMVLFSAGFDDADRGSFFLICTATAAF